MLCIQPVTLSLNFVAPNFDKTNYFEQLLKKTFLIR